MSPIKRLSDSAKPVFSRLGKIRKGAPKVDDRRPGADLDGVFRFTSDRPEIQDAFDQAYGAKPASINFYLPFPSIEENWECWQEAWVSGGMQHRCDGETAFIWLGEDGKYRQGQKPCPGGCKEVGRLSVVIPELLVAGYVGLVTLETHSIHDIMSIEGALQAAMLTREGNSKGLSGIPWLLWRGKQKISTPGQNGKRASREKSLLRIEPTAYWVQQQLNEAQRVAMLEAPKEQRADEDGVIMDEEPTEVEGEFTAEEAEEDDNLSATGKPLPFGEEAPDELNPPEDDDAPDLETPPTGTGALGQIYDLIAMAPDAHAVQVKRRFLATHKAERLEDISEDKLAAAIPWFKAELAK